MENNHFEHSIPRPAFPKRAVVTGGMPYGNKLLHFAHFGGYMVHADTFARFLRDRIGAENVIFVSGTDCYGSPALESFRKLKAEGKIAFDSVEEFVKSNYEKQRQTYLDFEIEHDLFGASGVGQTKAVHAEMSRYFFDTLYKQGTVSLMNSMQFYDEECQCLLNGRQVVGKCPIENCQSEKGYADECDLGHSYRPVELIDPVSTLSGKRPKLVEIKNWYFNLQEYIPALTDWLNQFAKRKDARPFMVKEINEFFKQPEMYVKKEHLSVLESLRSELPHFEDITANKNAPSVTIRFDTLTDRERAADILEQHQVRFRSGKTLVPFRLSGDSEWGVPFPTVDGVKDQTFYVWPESLWAPISFTKTYLLNKGKSADEWLKFWNSEDSEVYQFIGEDNLYFYGPAQQAIWMCMGLKNTNIIPSKHVLFLNKKASSSGSFKPPMALDLLEHYTAEQMRMHFLGMNLGNNNVSFMPKAFNPDAKPDEADVVLKEGNLLTNVYNRALRTVFYTLQNDFGGVVPHGDINPAIRQECKDAILKYERFMAEKKFHQVVNVVDVLVRNINKYWVKTLKDSGGKATANLIADTLEYIRVANVLLHPMAPHGTENVAKMLGLNAKWHNWQYIFEDVYFFFDDSDHHITPIKEKYDFFRKHPTQLEPLAQ